MLASSCYHSLNEQHAEFSLFSPARSLGWLLFHLLGGFHLVHLKCLVCQSMAELILVHLLCFLAILLLWSVWASACSRLPLFLFLLLHASCLEGREESLLQKLCFLQLLEGMLCSEYLRSTALVLECTQTPHHSGEVSSWVIGSFLMLGSWAFSKLLQVVCGHFGLGLSYQRCIDQTSLNHIPQKVIPFQFEPSFSLMM